MRRLIPRFETTLRDNIVGFWYPRCLDRVHGGYTVAFGPRGAPTGETSKGLVVQARMLWLFARPQLEYAFASLRALRRDVPQAESRF